MAKHEVGERVFAVESADSEKVRLFGRGVYEGEFDYEMFGLVLPNPRIKLDNGGTVYGCECWWGPESRFESFVGKRTIVDVPAPTRE